MFSWMAVAKALNFTFALCFEPLLVSVSVRWDLSNFAWWGKLHWALPLLFQTGFTDIVRVTGKGKTARGIFWIRFFHDQVQTLSVYGCYFHTEDYEQIALHNFGIFLWEIMNKVFETCMILIASIIIKIDKLHVHCWFGDRVPFSVYKKK